MVYRDYLDYVAMWTIRTYGLHRSSEYLDHMVYLEHTERALQYPVEKNGHSIRTQGLRNNHDPFDCENMSVRMCLCVRRAFSWSHVFFSHAFSAGVCWRARRVAGLRTARCAASCAHRCAASCAARSAEHHDASSSLFFKKKICLQI